MTGKTRHTGKSRRAVYVVLFRGVGGATQLPVAALRMALGEAGFGDVSTYINSGNAVLSSRFEKAKTHETITAILKQEFDFDKAIMLVDRERWQQLIFDNPFPDAVDEPTKLHVFTLQTTPAEEDVEALRARCLGGEQLQVRDNFLYLHVPNDFSASKLPPVLDRILKTVSTARNWRTVLALGRIAAAVE